MSELVSRAEYARMRGVSHTAVNNWVAEGKITLVDGKIDPALADSQWPRTQMEFEGPAEGSKAAAELRQAQAKAEMLEIRAATVKEEVVSRAEVRELVGEMIAKVKARLLLVPSRLTKFGAPVAREAETEINLALQELSHEVV